MELYRKFEEKLDGARQVGKTHIIRKYLKEHFTNFFYLNLYENVSSIETLIKSKDTDDFLLRLSLINGFEKKNDTVIFIDEIQEYYNYIKENGIHRPYYDILTGSKFIVDRRRVRIVFSGSLLRLSTENIISNPMGYLLPCFMYPLDFEEFALANKVPEKIIKIAKECFENKKEVPDYIHSKLSYLFNLYLLVGGMPKAVSEYLDSLSFVAVENAHKTISYYIDSDITKYAEDNEKLKIKEIYKILPAELSNPSKRFIISHIEGHKKDTNEQLSFSCLETAGVAIPVYVAKEAMIPLTMSSVRNQLKLFHEYTGILTHLMMDSSIKEKILNGDITANYGSIVENVCACLLRSHGFDDLFYYSNKKNGEVDFLIEKMERSFLLKLNPERIIKGIWP